VLVELAPRQVDELSAGQRVERVSFYRVDDLGRLAVGRDVVEPPARRVPLVEAEDVDADRVAAAEAVEEPAVEAALGECGLDAGDVHRLA
jgi:hypothetical protein